MPDPIAKLRALLDQATPGPWGLREHSCEDQTGERWSYTEIVAPSGDRVLDGCDDEQDHRDAQLIAALRNLAPGLLAVVDAAREAQFAEEVIGAHPALVAKIRALPLDDDAQEETHE